MTLRICVSILPKTHSEALALIEKAERAKADIVEVRLDSYESSRSLVELVNSTKLPLIATKKLVSENGFFAGTETQRQQALLNAAKNGFAFVDVNLMSPKCQETIQKLQPTSAQAIVSFHKFDGALSSSEMQKILEQEISTGASVCKIATTASKIEDDLAVLNFVAAMSGRTKLYAFAWVSKARLQGCSHRCSAPSSLLLLSKRTAKLRQGR